MAAYSSRKYVSQVNLWKKLGGLYFLCYNTTCTLHTHMYV